MKNSPTWSQVALVAVLLGAVIVTHVWAPVAVSAITSIVSTIIGAVFVNFQTSPDRTSELPPDNTTYRGPQMTTKTVQDIAAMLPAPKKQESAE